MSAITQSWTVWLWDCNDIINPLDPIELSYEVRGIAVLLNLPRVSTLI